MLFICLAASVLAADCDKLPPLSIFFVVDSSRSVDDDQFRNQLSIANGVLEDMRSRFRQHKQDPVKELDFGLLEFSSGHSIIRELAPDDGKNFDEGRRDGTGGTKYEQGLNAAISRLKAGSKKMKLIWFLTDGEPNGPGLLPNIPMTPAQVQELRTRVFVNQDITMVSTYLSNKPDLSAGTTTLQILSCQDPQAKCTDRVLAAYLKDASFNLESFKKKAADMFSSVVYSIACTTTTTTTSTINPGTPPEPKTMMIPLLVAALVAAAVLCICCCFYSSKKSKTLATQEEEASKPMTLRKTSEAQTATYIGTRRTRPESYRTRRGSHPY